ncbi:uncharacterized protein [Drosophila virilis]|uniref:Uncharacterized protein, isoform A n=1 Tax=Drosophila virilis TaxID=7244 RepID=B4LDP9_DROVI|nr:uncharacterized protein LOC6622673 isoform X1 [Drosophila virilis]EDW70010.2 uncharacterized protein Dvir_GJ11795, isoform A [Drosophila virilis]
MKLLGLGMQLLKRGQSSCTSGCQECDALPPCPPKPLWTGGRVLLFSMLTFGAGVYTGLYVSQNYEVPRVDDPPKLVEKMNKKIRELIDGKKTPVEQIVHDIKKEAKKALDD